jgi:hypothetical protein
MPVHISISLAQPRSILQRIIQRGIDLVAFGLTAANQVGDGQIVLPGVMLQFVTASDYALPPAQAKDEFGLWILQNGFRDVVEGLQEFLEEARVVCAALALGPRSRAPAGWDPPFRRESQAGQAFHFLGLERKLDKLRADYGVGLTDELQRAVLSINQARNCLAHRRGVVGPADFNEMDTFRLRWRALHFILKNNATGAETPLQLDQIVESESTLIFRIENADRTFHAGERLTVTTTEFTDHCFTLFAVANELGRTIDDYARAQGFDIPRPSQPPTGDEPPPAPGGDLT